MRFSLTTEGELLTTLEDHEKGISGTKQNSSLAPERSFSPVPAPAGGQSFTLTMSPTGALSREPQSSPAGRAAQLQPHGNQAVAKGALAVLLQPRPPHDDRQSFCPMVNKEGP